MTSHEVVRRRLLLTGAVSTAVVGAGAVGVWSGVVPGRSRVREALGVGQVRADVPDAGAGQPVFATFFSRARDREVGWGFAVPPGQEVVGLPVVIVLHGRGDDARAAFDHLGVHEFLAQHVAGGGAPFGVASVDGGSTYYHPRADGDDALTMIGSELLPLLAEVGFDTSRLGAAGWSMGGFGALLLAREAGAGRFAAPGHLLAAAASSPALFASAGATSPGSFDDAADFQRWGALAGDPGVRGVALTVSCGVDDPFREQTQRYREACAPTPEGGIADGAHDMDYWRSVLPAQLAFLGSHLYAGQ
ncbi:MAG: alpha/beta hydrolase [Janthinobacterium lividum]